MFWDSHLFFVGALDCRATKGDTLKQMAAVYALGPSCKRRCSRVCKTCLRRPRTSIWSDYLIPKPFDPRVLLWVAPAVAKAAMESGVARRPIEDFEVPTKVTWHN